jgi:hypothetical protein
MLGFVRGFVVEGSYCRDDIIVVSRSGRCFLAMTRELFTEACKGLTATHMAGGTSHVAHELRPSPSFKTPYNHQIII